MYQIMCLLYMLFWGAIVPLLSLIKVSIDKVYRYGLIDLQIILVKLIAGKLTTVKLLKTASSSLKVFTSAKSSVDEIVNVGERLISLLYGGSENTNLNLCRYTAFVRLLLLPLYS